MKTVVDIPAAIRRAQKRHPETPILYVWPFEVSEVAAFLATQVERHFEKNSHFGQPAAVGS